MTIIVDANILISALIKPAGKQAAIIMDDNDKVEFIAHLITCRLSEMKI